MGYRIGPHCGRAGCTCTHDRVTADGCYQGWIDSTRKMADGSTREITAPCPRCRPEQAVILRTSRSHRTAGRRLRARGPAAAADWSADF
jgi:hypothetical protein